VNPPQWPGQNDAQRRCVALLRKKGINPSSAADFSFAFNICDSFFLYDLAVRANGGRTDGPGVARAIQAMGSSYLSVENLDGRAVFSPDQPDAPSLARYFAWTTACSCFTYRSTTIPIS
jgi:hypothetical protein